MNIKFKILISSLFIIFCVLSSSLKAITSAELKEFAIKQNDAELLEILMKFGDSDDFPILIRAMEKKDYFAVFILIEYGVDINSRKSKGPYNYALDNIPTNCRTVLEMAIASDELSLVEYFLLNKADPTKSINLYQELRTNIPHKKYRTDWATTAVYDAIILDRVDVLILFAQYGVDLNEICYEQRDSYGGLQKKTPLQLAIGLKKKNIVAFLISIGIVI